jgi:hypothetical protein
LIEESGQWQVVIGIVILVGFPGGEWVGRFSSRVLVDRNGFEDKFAYRKAVSRIEVIGIASGSGGCSVNICMPCMARRAEL